MSAGRPVEPEELSALGFGCYRVDVRSGEHRAALEHALRAGCNLIDTASNYADGRSEELVGRVLEDTGHAAFVVTKAGYVSPALARDLSRAELLPAAVDGASQYSLEPDVLRMSLALSRRRLRMSQLDCVLLHNPERLMESGMAPDEIGGAIERALELLDDEVSAKRLRFYGMSSNRLPSAGPGDSLDLQTVLRSAARAGDPDRFAFVEFPLNLLERDGATDGSRPALTKRAAGKVRTIVNRPLNAIGDGELVRLAPAVEDATADAVWERCVGLVEARLAAIGEDSPWTSFGPMQFLRDNRGRVADADLVDMIWAKRIDPFVTALYDGHPTRAARAAFAELRTLLPASDPAHTRRAVARLTDDGLLQQGSSESLAVAACRYCLDAGADHVVVGMRRAGYVDTLAPLLRARSAGSASGAAR